MFRVSLIFILRKAALLRVGSFVLSAVLFTQSFTVRGSERLEVSDSPSYRTLGAQFAEAIASTTREGCNALFKSRAELNGMLGGLRTDAREIERIAELARRIESGEENVETVRELRGRIQELQARVGGIDSRREGLLWLLVRESMVWEKMAREVLLGLTVVVGFLDYVFWHDQRLGSFRYDLVASISIMPLLFLILWEISDRRLNVGHARQQRELRATRIEMLREFADGYRTRMTELGLPVDQEFYRALRNGNLARVEQMLEVESARSLELAPSVPTVRVRAQSETTEDSSGASEQEVVEVDTSSESQDRREVVE